MILAFIILSVTLLDTQAKLMTLSQSQALSTQISALDSLGAYSVIQLAIAILGCVFILAVMTLPRSLDSSVMSQTVKRLCDILRNYLKSNVAEEKIPDHVIKSLARLFLPDILEFYSTKDSTEPEQSEPPVEPVACTAPIRGNYRLRP